MNKNQTNLKRIFSEILFGYSTATFKDSKIKVNHLTPKQDMELDFYYLQVEEESLKKKYPSEEDKIKELYELDIWTKEKDQKIVQLKEERKGVQKTRDKVFQKSLLDQLSRNEKRISEELEELELERRSLLYPTREDYINKRINDYYIFLSFRYEDGSQIFNSFSELDESDDDLIKSLREIFSKVYSDISYPNIKKISVSPFFLEMFMCCDDNPQVFYGESVKNLTNFQVLLFNTAKKYKNLIQNCEIDIPEEYFEDPDRLVGFLNKSKNEQEADSKNKFENRGVMDEGLDNDFNKRMREKAKQNGGELDMREIMKMHGNLN